MSKNSNGKGDTPRNNFSQQFYKNYESINWKKPKPPKKIKKKSNK